jgi:glycosyltransferase involved in cell wall biosynthesis
VSGIRQVLYLAAHGGFAGQDVPLGGGAAVFNLLLDQWRAAAPFEVLALTPAILGAAAPGARQIVSFGEREYARFSRAFGAACTAEVLRHDPRDTAVLVNDVSEGPDFARLAAAGFRMVNVWHVDVVAYIASIYLRGWASPRTLARAWEALRRVGLARLSPAILRLVFEQQRASLRCSTHVVVPSSGMRDVILGAYPETPPGRVQVVPWGSPALETGDPAAGAEAVRQESGIPAKAPVLLCLSRISPEKGQDLLLEALIEWEQSGEAMPPGLHLLICGLPAYMQGEGFHRRLLRLAARLRKVKVLWPGYVSGARKQALFALADLYVFPSRHESFGLTLLEAFAAGLPAVCVDHFGAREAMRPEFGAVVPARPAREARRGLWRAIARLLRDREALRRMGGRARDFARARPFSASAARLAELLAANPGR